MRRQVGGLRGPDVLDAEADEARAVSVAEGLDHVAVLVSRLREEHRVGDPVGADRVGERRVLASGITAIITFNDLMALGLLRACRSHNTDVPDRLSIIGFDDIFGADLTTPALTTIRTPLAAIGETAMHHLLTKVDADNDTSQVAELPTDLVLRESTGPAR